MQGFLQVRKQMQEQIDPGRPRAESMPHRNPELQVWGEIPTPEPETCRVPAATWPKPQH